MYEIKRLLQDLQAYCNSNGMSLVFQILTRMAKEIEDLKRYK